MLLLASLFGGCGAAQPLELLAKCGGVDQDQDREAKSGPVPEAKWSEYEERYYFLSSTC